MSSLSHQRAKELLDASLNSQLISFERGILDHHLKNCAACRSYALAQNELEQRLTENLQARWSTPTVRQAELQTVTQTVQQKARQTIPREHIKNIGRVSLLATAVTALIAAVFWALNIFSTGAFVAQDTPLQPVSPQQLHTLLLTETELNCDGASEHIYAVHDIALPQSPIVGLQIKGTLDNKFTTLWQLNAEDLNGSAFDQPILVQTGEGCIKLLGVTLYGSPDQFLVFNWDGRQMTQVLKTTGTPILQQQQRQIQLGADGILHIQITENINAAKCSTVTVDYQWDGQTFVEVAQNLNPGIGCNTQN